MASPEPKLLNDLIRAHAADFTSYELWLTDGLSKHLADKRSLDPDSVAVVVDLDDLDPVVGSSDNSVVLRYNGRFFPPSRDAAGAELKTTPEEWREMTAEWFGEVNVDVTVDDDAIDVVKFTAMVPSIVLPDEVTGEDDGGDSDTADDGGDEAGSEEDSGDEPFAEDDAGGDDEATLDELEDALS